MNKNTFAIAVYSNIFIFCIIAISCNKTEKLKSNKDGQNFEERINLLEQKVDSLMDSEMKEEAIRRAKKDGFDTKQIKGS